VTRAVVILFALAACDGGRSVSAPPSVEIPAVTARGTPGGVRLVYTAERRDAADAAMRIVRDRMDAAGMPSSVIYVRDERVVIELHGGDAARASEVKAMVSVGGLEIKRVDDDLDLFATRPTALPDGAVILDEHGRSHEGELVVTHFAEFYVVGSESLDEVLARARSWLAEVAPSDAAHEIAFAKVHHSDHRTQNGWRTYHVWRKVELDGTRVREAVAELDHERSWMVTVHLDTAGAAAFETLTAANVNRRLAILHDGFVESAPLVMEKISGGVLRISMGGRSFDEQARDAAKLAAALRGAALPARLELVEEAVIPATE
jgi:preprotein translocase subunit SecD